MWNLKVSSKITEEKFIKKNYLMHQQKLRNMRSKIRIKQPEQPGFVYIKPKLEMSRRDRLIEIDRQNEILVNKMELIKTAMYTQNRLRPEAQRLKTLNQHVLNQQADNIYIENKRICKKLLQIQSFYPTFDIIDKTDNLERMRQNISENARRTKSVRNLHTRPQSSLTTRSSRFYKSKVTKFDAEGNNSQQKMNILYKISSEADIRPESAPSFKKFQRRPYSSEKPMQNRLEQQNAEEREQTGQKFNQY